MGHESPYIIPRTTGSAKSALETEPKGLAASIFDHIDGFFAESFRFHDYGTSEPILAP
jgi:hypothetical protein